ncbi:MAG: inactive transglutaminase family protein [Gammaproteobacteria bacterium]|nr:inactive transglutaminase family protein [Gammaproteobacteria bacterium]
MNSLTARGWAVALILIGLVITAYKSYELGLPLTPEQHAEVWTVQAQVSFQGKGGPAKLSLYIPENTPGFMLLDEDFISSRYGLTIAKSHENRKADWAIRRAKGAQTLYYRISVARSNLSVEWEEKPAFPSPPDYEEPYASAIRAIIEDVREESADVESYTLELLKQLNSNEPNENVELIRDQASNAGQWTNEIINVLKGVRIPARIIWGIDISDTANDALLRPLLQVHNGSSWLSFDPETGREGIPANFLVWKVGDKSVSSLDGGKDLDIKFSVTRTYAELIDIARQGAAKRDSFFSEFSLLSLPVQNQNAYQLLLMLPLGALLVVFLRTVIGLKTFGTFMPILIAMAFRETQLFWGVIMFSLIVSIGLMIRFYLEKLFLLLVPRLASVLVIVVILMLLISLVTNQLGVERVLSISLFPMVILAMTIERMSITWEENGARDAILQGLGSLLVASIGYVVMTNENLMYLIFVFPELLLVVLGLCLWMGGYTGYRLTELVRFKGMVGKAEK